MPHYPELSDNILTPDERLSIVAREMMKFPLPPGGSYSYWEREDERLTHALITASIAGDDRKVLIQAASSKNWVETILQLERLVFSETDSLRVKEARPVLEKGFKNLTLDEQRLVILPSQMTLWSERTSGAASPPPAAT